MFEVLVDLFPLLVVGNHPDCTEYFCIQRIV